MVPPERLVATLACFALLTGSVVGADAVALGVGIGERSPDQHLVVGEIEAVDQHARSQGDLFVIVSEVDARPAELRRTLLFFLQM
jgi:hypothetical protein